MPKQLKLTDIEVDEWLHDTDNANLFKIDGKEVWIPKSIGTFDETDSTVTVPEWWAIKEGLV